MKAIIETIDCTKYFGGLVAVDHLSMQVKEKEIVGLIGPNGAGKTTLLNLIAGRFSISSGDILFKGESIAHLKPYERVRQGIARTFQIPQPFNEMTVEENVMVGLMFGRAHWERDKGRVNGEEILAETGLLNDRQRLPGQLTLVQRKRLEVARALATNPEVLLLDEVMGGLNLKEVEDIMKLVVKLNSRGKTIVLVEHIMKVIMEISHRVVVMHEGQLLAEGEPRQVASDSKVIEAYMGKRFASRWGDKSKNAGSQGS